MEFLLDFAVFDGLDPLAVGAEDHGHAGTKLAWWDFDFGDVAELVDDFFEAVEGDIFIDDFSASEALDELNFVPIHKKAPCLVHADFDVVVVDFLGATEADFFHFRLFAGGTLASLFFGELELVTAVVHDFTDGWSGISLDLDEIEPSLAGHAHGLGGFDDPNLCVVLVDQTDRREADCVVDPLSADGSLFSVHSASGDGELLLKMVERQASLG